MGIILNHNRHRVFSYGSIIVVLLIALESILLIPIMQLSNGNYEHILKLMTWLSYANITLRLFYTAQFVLAALAVKTRFTALNKYLMKLAAIDKVWGNIASKHEEIQRFRRTYLKLCDGIEVINETFTFQLVFVFTSVMVRQFIFDS